MEWVETTGRTVQEAVEAALDELGVDEQDAEVVVVNDGRKGFAGLLRVDARVRVRVRPAVPRPKRPQRPRRSRERNGGGSPRPARSRGGQGGAEGAAGVEAPAKPARSAAAGVNGEGRRQGRQRRPAPVAVSSAEEGTVMSTEEQLASAEAFVRGVVERFGYEASIAARSDEEQILVEVTGNDLGLLIGQRGVTLDALQELARTVVQRRSEEHAPRVTVDVAGFRAKRAAALEQFARQTAAEVLESGTAVALEPMSPADRKIVHDTVNALAGVATTSEGMEPRRYVVVRPASGPDKGDTEDA